MANNCFVGTDSQLAADEKPVTVAEFAQRVQDKLLMKWWFLAPGYGYDPYLVHFLSQNGDVLKFSFVDCDTGKDVGGVHAISISDHELIHSKAPGTLPDANDYGAKRVIGFLMFNPRALARAGLLADATAAQTGTITASGKWPGTAAEPLKFLLLVKEHADLAARFADLRTQARALEEFISDLKQDDSLAEPIKARIDHLLSVR